jgi:predicted secreted protein
MIPVYSIAESGPKTSADTKEIRNHGAAETTLAKKFKTTVDMSGSGYVTKGDKGLGLLRRAALGGGMVYLRWVSPDDQAYEGYFEVSSGDLSAKTDEEYMNQFEFKAASATKVLDLTLR